MAEALGADAEMIRRGIGADPRIGYQFIYPGAGYGGSCFPKDLRALISTASKHNLSADIIASVEATNNAQKQKLFGLITSRFGQDLTGRTIGLWGLSFKPNTDDMREEPSIAQKMRWPRGQPLGRLIPRQWTSAQASSAMSRGSNTALPKKRPSPELIAWPSAPSGETFGPLTFKRLRAC